MKSATRAVILAAFITAGIAAQAPPADVERLGPQVGDVVPDFSAVDQ